MKVIFNSIFKSIKKVAKKYITMAAQNGYLMYTSGSYPTTDYFYIGENRKESLKK